MAIGERINTQELNIRDFSIDRLEMAVEFDPIRDVKEEEWKQIKDYLEKYNSSKYAETEDYPAWALTVLLQMNPEKIKEVAEKCQEIVEKQFWKNYARFVDDGELCDVDVLGYAVQDAAVLKIFAPDKFSQYGIDGEGLWEMAKENSLDTSANQIETQIALKVLYPNKMPLDLREEVLDPDLEMVQSVKDYGQAEEWANFTNYAMLLKVGAPDVLKEIRVTAKAWDGIRTTISDYLRDGNIREAVVLIADAGILAAEEVRVTEAGLKIKMPEPKVGAKTQDLPEVKKF